MNHSDRNCRRGPNCPRQVSRCLLQGTPVSVLERSRHTQNRISTLAWIGHPAPVRSLVLCLSLIRDAPDVFRPRSSNPLLSCARRRPRHCQASRAVFRKLASDNVGPQRRSLLCVVWLGVRRDFSDEGLAAPPLGRTGHPFEEIALSIHTRSRWLWRNGPSLETRRRLGQHPPLSHHGCQQALERGPRDPQDRRKDA